KKRIKILSIIIIGVYIYLSAGVFGAYIEGITFIPIPERLIYMNYFSSGVAQLFSLLIVPGTTIILLNIKEIDLEKSFLISRILVSISLLVILINLVFLNFAYCVWAIYYGTDIRVWGPFFGYTLFYFLIFLLSLTVLILMRVKLETKE
ncbi:unnamed protein product, partial [marine sediment metagenome]